MKELSVKTRDDLNAKVDEMVALGTKEGHVLACCMCLAIEAIEEWLYGGGITPSVAPFRDGRKFVMPDEAEPSVVEDGGPTQGPEWKRTKIPLAKRMPIVGRILEESKRNPIKIDGKVWLGDLEDINNWPGGIRAAFEAGDYKMFISGISTLLLGSREFTPMRVVSDTARSLMKKYRRIYGSKAGV
jgi:hypothetical protein